MRPEEINDRFGEAYNAGDLARLLLLYEDDAILDFGPTGRVQGLAAIHAALAPFVALRGTIRYQRRFCIVFGDLALLSIAYRLTDGRAPDGTPVNSSGVTMELARRQQDGTWKYLIDVPNGGSAA
jgi:ketosteroid isomerase-like protein